jgi:demethylmenaquinone methyltransferase/2-methoxy-6-polyprenyl-1,4-benzoquinol methylase
MPFSPVSGTLVMPATPAPRSSSDPTWTAPLLADPHAVGDKAQRVRRMFVAIAPSYDLNNRLHSLGMDQHWRSVAVKMAEVKATDTIVDVACGTGDLTLKLARKKSEARSQNPDGGVVGIDFTYDMLPIARRKAAGLGGSAPAFMQGDAVALPLADKSADIVSIAFGIRNVADWGKAIDEFARVLKPGGRLIILEFSLPENALLRGLYNFYFRRILPRTATWISGDQTGAYRYLPESVNTFISREAMQERMARAGFGAIEARPLTLGICVCYKGVRA